MGSFAGTGALVRLALRRDRVMLPIWILVIAGLTAVTASSFAELYPTVQSRQEFAASLGNNPSLIALYGRPFDLTSVGGLTAWRMLGVAAVLAALMSTFTVVRHTRAEEESGRLELVRAGVVGRYAPLSAGLLVAFGTNLVLAVLVVLGLTRTGQPAGGAFAFGLALAAAGWVFAAVAAGTAQLTEGARAANGVAGSMVGLSFLLRAVGDVADPHTRPAVLSWLSPVGWSQQVRPFAGERWWVFAVALALVLVLTGSAYALAARRDLGAGLMPPRPGPAQAGPWLRSPLGLAWRLHRGALAGWAAAFAMMGAVLGSVAAGIADLFADNEQLTDILTRLGGEQGVVDAFLAAEIGLVGSIAAVYAVQATLRLRSEETGLRAEPVLATAVSRIRWAAGHLAVAAVGTAVLLVAVGLGIGLAHGLRTHDVGTQLPRLLGAALVALPAAWVLLGLTTALFGLAPRLTVLSWAAVLLFLLLGQFGPVLRLDQRVMDVSPFAHVPRIPGGELSWTPLGWLTAVAAALVAAGLVGFRRRDVDTG